MLDLNEARRVFADHLGANADRRHSLDAALMAACEWAYRKGLQDGADAEMERIAGEARADNFVLAGTPGE